MEDLAPEVISDDWLIHCTNITPFNYQYWIGLVLSLVGFCSFFFGILYRQWMSQQPAEFTDFTKHKFISICYILFGSICFFISFNFLPLSIAFCFGSTGVTCALCLITFYFELKYPTWKEKAGLSLTTFGSMFMILFVHIPICTPPLTVNKSYLSVTSPSGVLLLVNACLVVVGCCIIAYLKYRVTNYSALPSSEVDIATDDIHPSNHIASNQVQNDPVEEIVPSASIKQVVWVVWFLSGFIICVALKGSNEIIRYLIVDGSVESDDILFTCIFLFVSLLIFLLLWLLLKLSEFQPNSMLFAYICMVLGSVLTDSLYFSSFSTASVGTMFCFAAGNLFSLLGLAISLRKGVSDYVDVKAEVQEMVTLHADIGIELKLEDNNNADYSFNMDRNPDVFESIIGASTTKQRQRIASSSVGSLDEKLRSSINTAVRGH